MKAKLFLAAALSLAATACSTAAAPESTPGAAAQSTASAQVNPVGRFDFNTTVQGEPITGTIAIEGTPGAYTGQITTSITPPLPISGATVSGQQVVISGNTPDGVITIRLNFTDGDNFTGGWELAGDSGSVTGRRASS